MERIFLSYTYNPIEAYRAEANEFVSHLKIMIDCMGISVTDAIDVGGRAINPFVVSELNEANQSDKPVLAVVKPGVEQPYGLDNNLQRVEIDFDAEDAGDNLAEFLGKFEA
jgi:hypothetical protein